MRVSWAPTKQGPCSLATRSAQCSRASADTLSRVGGPPPRASIPCCDHAGDWLRVTEQPAQGPRRLPHPDADPTASEGLLSPPAGRGSCSTTPWRSHPSVQGRMGAESVWDLCSLHERTPPPRHAAEKRGDTRAQGPRVLAPQHRLTSWPTETRARCVPSGTAVTDSWVHKHQGRLPRPAGVTVPTGCSEEADALGGLKTKVATRDLMLFLVTLPSKSRLFSGFSTCHRRAVKRQPPTKRHLLHSSRGGRWTASDRGARLPASL